jgi:hypothetical protein
MKRWTERSSAMLEKDVMVGFYAIRKLIESHTVADETRDTPIRLVAYRWTGKPVTYMNWHKIDQKYDLDHPVSRAMPVARIADLFIHSFVFMASCDERGRLESILFNSDRTRRHHLYSVRVDDVVELFEKVGKDYPAASRAVFNEETGDYDVWVGTPKDAEEAGA